MFDAISSVLLDEAYLAVREFNLQNLGMDAKVRGCAYNSSKSCRCQGTDNKLMGRSFTFGCTESVCNRKACKFAVSKKYVRKFKLEGKVEEEDGMVELVV